ncbi:Putative uncharacterized protein [Staphylococcus xylosus]|nr:Putative uncharacterized protein [Staphylococcus xylosus]
MGALITIIVSLGVLILISFAVLIAYILFHSKD